MEKVYIAGPITNTPDYKRNFMIREAHLKSMGYIVVNPIKVGEQLKNQTAWREPTDFEYMKKDIQELLKCDCISMLDGWENSKGATLEYNIAVQCGIKFVKTKLFNPSWNKR